jgi:hypothetical protein
VRPRDIRGAWPLGFPGLLPPTTVDKGDAGHTVLGANAAPVTRSGVRRGATSANSKPSSSHRGRLFAENTSPAKQFRGDTRTVARMARKRKGCLTPFPTFWQEGS